MVITNTFITFEKLRVSHFLQTDGLNRLIEPIGTLLLANLNFIIDIMKIDSLFNFFFYSLNNFIE